MSKFQLFDAVSLTEEIALVDGGVAPPETAGAIVEVFKNGEAYLVELFGGWVKAEVGGDFIPANADVWGCGLRFNFDVGCAVRTLQDC
jgi:hypothetical protein